MSALVRNVQGEKSYTQNICYESTHTHLSEGIALINKIITEKIADENGP